MLHYASGTPKNDAFQAIENQLCSQRLLSMYRDYQPNVFRWLKDVKTGIRKFDDWLASNRDAERLLDQRDRSARQMFEERGLKVEWPGYAAAMQEASNRLPGDPPQKIILDSGAFTAWNKPADKRVPVSLEDLIPAYERFLSEGDSLFDEVWLVNLDVIPGEPGRDATPDEIAHATACSDANLKRLRCEFGDKVLPVFHQGEGTERLLEVIDQAQGYLCLSPTNKIPEDRRWQWATIARCALSDLDCDVRTHGLATTGNDMIRHATLFSGDSEAWQKHAGFGKVDLIDDETIIAEHPVTRYAGDVMVDQYTRVEEKTRSRYRAFHIGIERNDWDRGTEERLIEQVDHISLISTEKQRSVRSEVGKIIAFPLAQVEMRARSLVNLATFQKHAASFSWKAPTGPSITVKDGNGNELDPEPYYGKKVEVRAYPTPDARQRFLAMSRGYPGL
ncbi:hypothetical protein [Acidimangrovimonas sediminis]|uniref:hypothetical protein n=1 Tax=Acidimangrovimonas sediminis TaxID=2056283 RepID=UPI000C8050A6|nr:hypothetical protein [Acidimangrovimonas sediminis]